LGVRQLGGFERAELIVYDRLMQWRSPEPVDDRVLIVRVTERDIQQYGRSLSDDTVADLLEHLQAAEARVIGLNLIRDIPVGTGSDRLLNALQGSDRIITTCDVSQGLENRPPPPSMTRDQIGFRNFPTDAHRQIRRFFIGQVPPPPAEGSGPVQHPCHDTTEPVFSLSFQVVAQYLAEDDISVQFLPNGALKLGTTVLPALTRDAGSYQWAAIEGYQLMLNPRSPQAAESVLMSEVLSGNVPPEQIRDRIVLIGYTAPSAAERYRMPGLSAPSSDVPNVVLQAQAISHLLSMVLDNRPQIWFWVNPVEVLWIVLWSAVGGSVAWWLQRPERIAIAGVISAGVLGLLSWSLLIQGGWIPVVAPWSGFILTGIGVLCVERGGVEALYRRLTRRQRPTLLLTAAPEADTDRSTDSTAVAAHTPLTEAQADTSPILPDAEPVDCPEFHPSPTLERTPVPPIRAHSSAMGEDYLTYVHQRLNAPSQPTQDSPDATPPAVLGTVDEILDDEDVDAVTQGRSSEGEEFESVSSSLNADSSTGSIEVSASSTLLDPAERYLNAIRIKRDRLQSRRQSRFR
jgi:CHASE2 domain-containing sensor protein